MEKERKKITMPAPAVGDLQKHLGSYYWYPTTVAFIQTDGA